MFEFFAFLIWTVEIVVGFRKNPAPPASVILCGSPVDSVESCRFLGTIITQDLKWERNIRSLTKKAQQRMFFLQQLKKSNNDGALLLCHHQVYPHLHYHRLVPCCPCYG